MRRREELRYVPILESESYLNSRNHSSWSHREQGPFRQQANPAHRGKIICPFRHALDIREHYERKLERANNLYMELNALMLQLELKERELLR